MLNARSHNLNATLGISVEAPKLALFFGATDTDCVGAIDDLGLGTLAPCGLRIATFGLDPSQGVKGAHERQLEFVLHAVRHEAAEPIVGMHDIDTGSVADVLDDSIAELFDHMGEIFFGEIEWASRQMHHAMAGLYLNDLGQAGPRCSGVGGAINAGLCQR